jgi:ribosomal protein S18 acetylase RimI-like enzyme
LLTLLVLLFRPAGRKTAWTGLALTAYIVNVFVLFRVQKMMEHFAPARIRFTCVAIHQTAATISMSADGNIAGFLKGPLQVKQVEEGGTFWCIYDELGNKGFFHNRNQMVEAFAAGTLYYVLLKETDNNYNSKELRDLPLFMDKTKAPFLSFPAFGVCDIHGEIVMLWVHQRARRRGIGKAIVNHFKLLHKKIKVSEKVFGSDAFWKVMDL